MKRWEYLVVAFEMNASADGVSDRLANYGNVGWELVATRPVITSVGSKWDWLAIFKRAALSAARQPEGGGA